jgi:hypothetical protein
MLANFGEIFDGGLAAEMLNELSLRKTVKPLYSKP